MSAELVASTAVPVLVYVVFACQVAHVSSRTMCPFRREAPRTLGLLDGHARAGGAAAVLRI